MGIGDWGLGLGIGDWDWGLEMGLGIGDWRLGFEIGIGDRGRMTNDNDYTLHFVLMQMKFILFLHIMIEHLICFFEGCVVAGLMKN